METVEFDPTGDADLMDYDGFAERLGLHLDSFSATEEEVRAYPYAKYVAETDETAGDESYEPVDHIEAYEVVGKALSDVGMQVTEVHHGLSRGGKRYGVLYGLFPQKQAAFTGLFSDYRPVVFVRNSYDQTYPLLVQVGAHFYDTDTLLISGTEGGRRRHTSRFQFDLYETLSEIVFRVEDLLLTQDMRFSAYREARRDGERDLHDFIFRAYEEGIIPVTYMPDAKAAATERLAGRPPSVYTQMQAVLSARRGKDIFALARLTADLEQMCDREVGFDREAAFERAGSEKHADTRKRMIG